jgi:Protein-L-isoaspartate(D-aspartate) O-methyltransferase (PCMT)
MDERVSTRVARGDRQGLAFRDCSGNRFLDDRHLLALAATYGNDHTPAILQLRQRLARLGYRNISVKIGDGNDGWPEHAPSDGIVVTAAAREIPKPQLVDRL